MKLIMFRQKITVVDKFQFPFLQNGNFCRKIWKRPQSYRDWENLLQFLRSYNHKFLEGTGSDFTMCARLKLLGYETGKVVQYSGKYSPCVSRTNVVWIFLLWKQKEHTTNQVMAAQQKKTAGESWPLPSFESIRSIFLLIKCRPTYVVQTHVGFTW